MKQQVEILRAANVDAVISIGAYAAAAAFVRDAVDAGWDVPIANVSFVGSESMLQLLLDEGKKTGKDYTRRLVNSQVVPSYEDVTLPAVREYREFTTKYAPPPPPGFGDVTAPPTFSFVGFEGFLNAKLMVEILKGMGSVPDPFQLRETVEKIQNFDLGIAAPVTFGPGRNRASPPYTTRAWRMAGSCRSGRAPARHEVFKLGLAGQVSDGITLLFLLITITTSLVSAWNLDRQLTASSKPRAARLPAASPTPASVLLARDGSSLQAMIDGFLDISGVGYVFVLDGATDRQPTPSRRRFRPPSSSAPRPGRRRPPRPAC